MTNNVTSTNITRRSVLKGAGAAGIFGAFAGFFPSSSEAATATTIKRVNNSKFTYECITTAPQNLQKLYSTDFNTSTMIGNSQLLEDHARAGGYSAIINCDSWNNANGATTYNDSSPKRPVGIQVLNGKLLQNYGRSHSELAWSDKHAFYMNSSYTLHHINNTGLSDAAMQKYLTDNKALWSAGYGPYLVNYGTAVTDFTGETYTDVMVTPSARTCLGQKSDGTIVIVVIKGQTGNTGATVYDCAQVMKKEGCYNATLLDGGGSSQIYWNGRYIHPSSDPAGKRKLGGGFLAIKGSVPSVS